MPPRAVKGLQVKKAELSNLRLRRSVSASWPRPSPTLCFAWFQSLWLRTRTASYAWSENLNLAVYLCAPARPALFTLILQWSTSVWKQCDEATWGPKPPKITIISLKTCSHMAFRRTSNSKKLLNRGRKVPVYPMWWHRRWSSRHFRRAISRFKSILPASLLFLKLQKRVRFELRTTIRLVHRPTTRAVSRAHRHQPPSRCSNRYFASLKCPPT